MGAIAFVVAGVGFAIGCGLGTWIALRLKMHPLLALLFVMLTSFLIAVAAAAIPASVMGA